MVTYGGSDIEVRVGDHVTYREWLFFWRGWKPGRVVYVPGLSPAQPNLEHNGLRWGCIQDVRGTQVGVVVEPQTNELQRSVRFVRRTDDRLTQTPADFSFED